MLGGFTLVLFVCTVCAVRQRDIFSTGNAEQLGYNANLVFYLLVLMSNTYD